MAAFVGLWMDADVLLARRKTASANDANGV